MEEIKAKLKRMLAVLVNAKAYSNAKVRSELMAAAKIYEAYLSG